MPRKNKQESRNNKNFHQRIPSHTKKFLLSSRLLPEIPSIQKASATTHSSFIERAYLQVFAVTKNDEKVVGQNWDKNGTKLGHFWDTLFSGPLGRWLTFVAATAIGIIIGVVVVIADAAGFAFMTLVEKISFFWFPFLPL